MSSREIVLWIDERWYKALNRHLKNETLEEHMEDVLDELCNQLPQREYERISREIWQEDQENRQAREASRRFTVFHVTENGESVYFSVEGSLEMLQVANHLREHLSDENAVSKFASAFPLCEKITQEQFDAAVAERMKNTGRVTGAYELDFDEKTFAALDSTAGWKTFGMKDVSSAAYSAMRKAQMETADRINIFLSKLDGKELPAQNAAQKIAVFHVTENGESMCFSVAESLELLQTAVHLRNYLSDENADTKFTAIFPYGEKISQEQFDAAAAERMENTGRVTGAYELDFDARTFSALNIIDGWKVYAMQDVADAARQAFQDAEMSEYERWRIFIDRLDGQELTAPSRLTARNFYFEDSIEAIDDQTLNFYVVPCFNVDKAFGTFVETDENDHALNIYANYDMQCQQVCDELEITLYGSGIEDQSLTYHLNAAEKEVLREKMEAYCMQREHMPLNQLCQEILQELDAPTQEMQM